LREREGEADEREPIRATPTGSSSSDALGTAPIRFKAIRSAAARRQCRGARLGVRDDGRASL